jgi:TPP-dependent indolepyruvate ferredoxin oxidoreductase alpha subunit
MIVIRPEYCTRDNICMVISFCPSGAVSHIPGEVPEIDIKKCTNCYKCVHFCPAFIEITEPVNR